MHKTAWATVLAAVWLSFLGCEYEVPITASPTRKVEEKLLGDWISKDGKDKMKVRRLDDFIYVILMNDGLVRAYHSEVAKTPFVSVDDYSSPAGLDVTLKTISDIMKKYSTTTRPDLADGTLWSAVSTVGLAANRDYNTMNQQLPGFLAVNTKYSAKTLYFTWRSPPGAGDGFAQPWEGPALCGKNNNYVAGTLCGN